MPPAPPTCKNTQKQLIILHSTAALCSLFDSSSSYFTASDLPCRCETAKKLNDVSNTQYRYADSRSRERRRQRSLNLLSAGVSPRKYRRDGDYLCRRVVLLGSHQAAATGALARDIAFDLPHRRLRPFDPHSAHNAELPRTLGAAVSGDGLIHQAFWSDG